MSRHRLSHRPGLFRTVRRSGRILDAAKGRPGTLQGRAAGCGLAVVVGVVAGTPRGDLDLHPGVLGFDAVGEGVGFGFLDVGDVAGGGGGGIVLVDIFEVAAAPGCDPESEAGVELYQTVEVSEEEVTGEHEEVLGLAKEIRGELDHLCAEDPDCEKGEGSDTAEGALVESVGEGGVVEEREIDERGEVDGIDAPGLAVPNGAISKETAGIAAPGGAHPAETLREERRVGTKGGLNQGVGTVLDLDFVPVRDVPAGYIVVVIGVEGAELVEKEALVGESGEEGKALDDFGAVGGGSSGDDKDPPIYRIRRADLKIMALQIDGPEHVPEGAEIEAGVRATNALVGADDADSGVLERGEDRREKSCGRPENVVIQKDGDGRLDVLHTVGYLEALVSMFGGPDTDGGVGILRLNRCYDALGQGCQLLSYSDDDDGTWPIF